MTIRHIVGYIQILVNLRSSSLLHSESAFRIPSPLSTHLILPETLPPGSFVWALDCTLYVALPSLRVSLEEVAADDSFVVGEQQQQNEEEADEHFQRRETLEKKRKRLANAFSISIQQQNGSSSSSFSVVLRTRRSLLGLAGAYPRGLVVVLSTAKGDSDEKNGTRPRKEKEEKEWPLNITILARSQCAPMFDHGQDAVFYVVNGKVWTTRFYYI